MRPCAPIRGLRPILIYLSLIVLTVHSAASNRASDEWTETVANTEGQDSQHTVDGTSVSTSFEEDPYRIPKTFLENAGRGINAPVAEEVQWSPRHQPLDGHLTFNPTYSEGKTDDRGSGLHVGHLHVTTEDEDRLTRQTFEDGGIQIVLNNNQKHAARPRSALRGISMMLLGLVLFLWIRRHDPDTFLPWLIGLAVGFTGYVRFLRSIVPSDEQQRGIAFSVNITPNDSNSLPSKTSSGKPF
ncbi:hypothetical protein cyc_08645 [Cyclospora cayetanensis]|uniref:Transmembrane protein n=1 Tax=Cyclospora cayetanensis TaxID=88456 RepID=A0A1D3D3I8_9EIME|nr:hypothetical protein cyc_08645 [Cyclospora cayetanensis]